jgi:hypothetical protein
MSKHFLQRKIVGDNAEYLVNEMFLSCGFKSKISQEKTDKHDIVTKVSNNLSFTTEVKYDEMEATTGNVAIEVYNTTLNKPSGIRATQAFFWIFVLADKSIWITTVASLREYINTHQPLRKIENCGDGNATILLYDSSVILPNIFVRIDKLDPKKIHKYIIRRLTNG